MDALPARHLLDTALGAVSQSFQIGRIAYMFAWPAVFARIPGLDRCGCCGGVYRRRQVTELASTRGVFICRECAQFAAMPR